MNNSASACENNGRSENASRRRALFLVGQLGFGGSEGQLRLLLENMSRESWDLCLLVYHPSPNADHAGRLEELGIEVVHSDSRRPYLARKLRSTVHVARRFRPDIVQSWTVHDNPFARLAAFVSGAKLCWGSLRGSTRLPGFQGLPPWYRRLALRSVERLVVNSSELAMELSDLGLSDDRIFLLRNCVEIDDSSCRGKNVRILDDFGVGSENPVFASIGNIRRVKNQLLFVRAMAKVIQKHPMARGLVVGETLDGEEIVREAIEHEITANGLEETVLLTGFRGDVPQLMRALTAVCMTSDSEGMPNVVLEAMAVGVPVISTRVGGVPQVIRDGETGLLIDAGDEQGLEEAICQVLEQPSEAKRMAESAKRLVREKRNCRSMARALELAYGGALEPVPGPSA